MVRLINTMRLVYCLLGLIYVPSKHYVSFAESTLANTLSPVSAAAKQHLTELTFHRNQKFPLQEQRCFSPLKLGYRPLKLFFFKIYLLFYVCTSLSLETPEEGIRSHYR